MIYLLVMRRAIVMMVPAIIVAEKRGKMKAVPVAAIGLVLIGQLLLGALANKLVIVPALPCRSCTARASAVPLAWQPPVSRTLRRGQLQGRGTAGGRPGPHKDKASGEFKAMTGWHRRSLRNT
ncbi:hypothetical protein M3A49_35360 [Paraburkholderia sp. CNPSo 3076]|nr:hypothetical protein [Paraburkholderia sp. CNPSo 3076]MCX5544685.1 hypothetical protein [Paraburkholderia sp. CNPSo 3076]